MNQECSHRVELTVGVRVTPGKTGFGRVVFCCEVNAMNTGSRWSRDAKIPLDAGWWNELQSKLQDKHAIPLDRFGDNLDIALDILEKRFCELDVRSV